MKNMPTRPLIIKVLRPAFSIMIRETKVIATFIAPIPRVADWLACSSKPADSNILVEKKMAALIPDSCCANIIMFAIIRGFLRALLVNISLSVTLGTSFMASCSCFISSISSWTSMVERNQVKAKTLKFISFVIKNKTFS